MNCEFLGVCGSHTPIYPIKGFSHTPCVVVDTKDFMVIFDAGSGITKLNDRLKNETKPIFLVFSHFHYDHIIGLPFFSLIYNNKNNFTIVYPKPEKFDITLRDLFTIKFFPVPYSALATIPVLSPEEVSKQFGFSLTEFELNHPGGCYGYKLEMNNESILYVTDNEITDANKNKFTALFKNASLLIHDCYFLDESPADFSGWGHSFLADLLHVSLEAAVKQLCLFHYQPKISETLLSSYQTAIKQFQQNHPSSMNVISSYDDLIISYSE